MTELPKCGKVQIDSYRKFQHFVVESKKINWMKFELDRKVEFFANHMHLIMGNDLVKCLMFLSKNVVNRNMPYVLA